MVLGELEGLHETLGAVGGVFGRSGDLDHDPLEGLGLGGREVEELRARDDRGMVLQEVAGAERQETVDVESHGPGRDLQDQVLREAEPGDVPEAELLEVLDLEDVGGCEDVQGIDDGLGVLAGLDSLRARVL